jgi:ArsR family transcriptional regulator
VEDALREMFASSGMRDLLDIGTGTGRILELFGPQIERGVGIDMSREMLAVARANLQKADLRNCQVRQGDMYQLPFSDGSFDGVVIHQVLHYAEDPGESIMEAGRMLRPGGRLVVVDFAPHNLEMLREGHAHRRLGFADSEVRRWFEIAGLSPDRTEMLEGDPLTVCLWSATRAANDLQNLKDNAQEESA